MGNYRKKTKGRLIEELEALRDRVTELKGIGADNQRVEHAPFELQECYRRVLETVPLMVYSAEAGSNRFLTLEGLVEQILGYPPENFYADPDLFNQIVHPEDRPRVKAAFEDGLGSLAPFDLDYRVLYGTDGHAVWIRVHVVPIFGEDGRLLRQDGIITDITKLKRVEHALQRSEENYRRLFEQHPAACFAYDRHGVIQMWNQEAERLYGYERDQIIGKTIYDVFSTGSDDQGTVSKHLKRVVGGENLTDLELRDRCADGTMRWVLCNTFPIRDENGKMILAMSSRIDITARKETELRSERLVQAIESAGEGIGICDEQARLAYANRAFCRVFGCKDFAELSACSWISLVDGKERWWTKEIMPGIRKYGEWHGQLYATSRDGRSVPLSIMLRRIGGRKQDFQIVANVRDRTEEEHHINHIRKMTLDANMVLEKERAIISRELHDELGQSLTAMRMSLSWLKRRTTKAEAAVQQRTVFCHELAGQMIDVVRDLSKSLRPPILDHQGVIETLRSYVGEFGRNTGITCRFVAKPADLVLEEPFATTVYRIMQEALTNVARHAHSSCCDVYLNVVDDDLEMKIQDNGVGAEPGALTGSRSIGVVGMRERAAMIGGKVTVENNLKRGVCVTLRLPLVQGPKRTKL